MNVLNGKLISRFTGVSMLLCLCFNKIHLYYIQSIGIMCFQSFKFKYTEKEKNIESLLKTHLIFF